MLQGVGARFAVLLAMMDQRRAQDAVRARQALQKAGFPVMTAQISLLSAWPKAEASGVAVRDARLDSGRPDPGASRAWEQVVTVAGEIDQELA